MVQNGLEMPQQVREAAEKNFEQARTLYDQYSEAMTQAMGNWAKAITNDQLTTGFKAVQDRALGYAKINAESGSKLAGELATAKDIKEVMSLQNHYTQTQMQSYAIQAQELGRLMTEAARGIPSTT